jgi:hypothetical protein
LIEKGKHAIAKQFSFFYGDNEGAKIAMLTKPSFELAVRICIAFVLVAVGTYVLFDGMDNATVEGHPFSYGMSKSLNFLTWSMPSVVAITYLIIGRRFRFLSWVFIAFCCYWAYKALESYRTGFTFIYLHQGDVVCVACDNIYFTLASATILFGFLALILVLVRFGSNKPLNMASFLTGAIALFLLLFCAFAVGIS